MTKLCLFIKKNTLDLNINLFLFLSLNLCCSVGEHIKPIKIYFFVFVDVCIFPEPPLMSRSSATSTAPYESVMPLNTE